MAYSENWSERNLIKKIKSSRKKICYYCGKKIETEKDLTVDHLTPSSRGGLTTEENLEICCFKCNTEKSDMTEGEYKEYLKQKEIAITESYTYQTIRNMESECEGLILKYNSICSEESSKRKEVQEIEEIIKNSKCNAAEGYALYKDLRDLLIEIEAITNEKSELSTIISVIQNIKKNFSEVGDKIAENKGKKLRKEIGVTNLKYSNQQAI